MTFVGTTHVLSFVTHAGMVRRNGSFIYEEFLATGGTDVKVCAPSACTCIHDLATDSTRHVCLAAHTQH